MKRRDFVMAWLGGAAGSFLPILGKSQERPCAPSPLSVEGGSTAITYCEADAEADWLSRSTASGVVWAHDFRSGAEVDNFRWRGGQGDDPENTGDGSVRRITTDGVTGGGCLEVFSAPGTQAEAVWWRPFSPLTGSSNGRGIDDPGASDTIPREIFVPNSSSSGSTINSWSKGYYGHTDYHGMGAFDGTDYYLQYRCKLSASRFNADQPDFGKLMYLSLCARSLTGQEIVTQSRRDGWYGMYRSGSPPMTVGEESQPGSEYPPPGEYCNFGKFPSNCWRWPAEQWATVLIHVALGHNNVMDTWVQVWIAEAGQTTYTKIWDHNQYPMPYEENYPFGHNAMIASTYMNGAPAGAGGLFHRYDQVIFSKEFIPCPQV